MKKVIDVIIMLVLIALLAGMFVFTLTRETGNNEIILMEIYKSAGTDSNIHTYTNPHYFLYENYNTVDIKYIGSYESSNQSTSDVRSIEIDESLIENFKIALDNYISSNPEINTAFYINDRYTIEYNATSIIVPKPEVATLLGFDSTQYEFYNTIEDFINSIEN